MGQYGDRWHCHRLAVVESNIVYLIQLDSDRYREGGRLTWCESKLTICERKVADNGLRCITAIENDLGMDQLRGHNLVAVLDRDIEEVKVNLVGPTF